jgi:hypothetical protein
MCTCVICNKEFSSEEPKILAMGAYGNPKVLCDDCAELVETMTYGKDYDTVVAAMESLTQRMSASNVDDRVTVATVTEMLSECAERAQKIKEGTYDFSLDEEKESEGMDEIPEELRETEEDRLLDEKDAKANARFDKILNWLWIAFGILAGAVIIWRVISLLIG